MTTDLKASDFKALRGQSFKVTSTDPNIELALIEVENKTTSLREGGAFALTWKGPKDLVLEQGTYAFAHKEMPSLDIFIVPVDEDEDGRIYEAVFA